MGDPQIGSIGVRELQTYEQPEEFRSLAYVDLNRSILVGCESGKIIAFPLPVDDKFGPGDALPEVLSGIETPASERDDGTAHCALEALRKNPPMAAQTVVDAG